MNSDPSQLFAALNHVLRRRILRLFETDERQLASSSQFARAMDLPLSNVNYHVTVLAKTGALEFVRTRAGQGTEHLYRLALDGSAAWVRVALEASRDSDGDGGAARPA